MTMMVPDFPRDSPKIPRRVLRDVKKVACHLGIFKQDTRLHTVDADICSFLCHLMDCALKKNAGWFRTGDAETDAQVIAKAQQDHTKHQFVTSFQELLWPAISPKAQKVRSARLSIGFSSLDALLKSGSLRDCLGKKKVPSQR